MQGSEGALGHGVQGQGLHLAEGVHDDFGLLEEALTVLEEALTVLVGHRGADELTVVACAIISGSGSHNGVECVMRITASTWRKMVGSLLSSW